MLFGMYASGYLRLACGLVTWQTTVMNFTHPPYQGNLQACFMMYFTTDCQMISILQFKAAAAAAAKKSTDQIKKAIITHSLCCGFVYV